MATRSQISGPWVEAAWVEDQDNSFSDRGPKALEKKVNNTFLIRSMGKLSTLCPTTPLSEFGLFWINLFLT